MSSIQAQVSRFTIINWINDTLLLPLTKIQQLGAGNVYCQLLDAAYPERVPLHKVKWDARLEVDFLHNFKILQNSFQFLGIQKKIDIQKLSKAKYQDNLEFVQWLKTYVEQKIDYNSYQPLKRRNYAKLFLGFLDKKKFNVTISSTNKQNLDNSVCMRSSIKSNATIKSSSMISSRSSVSILSMANNNSLNKSILGQKSQDKKQVLGTKQPEKRKNVGPISFVSASQRPLVVKVPSSSNLKSRDQNVQNVMSKNIVKNVVAIESEGEEDQFF